MRVANVEILMMRSGIREEKRRSHQFIKSIYAVGSQFLFPFVSKKEIESIVVAQLGLG